MKNILYVGSFMLSMFTIYANCVINQTLDDLGTTLKKANRTIDSINKRRDDYRLFFRDGEGDTWIEIGDTTVRESHYYEGWRYVISDTLNDL